MARSAVTAFVAAGLAAAAVSLVSLRGAGPTAAGARPVPPASPAGAEDATPGILISRQLAELRNLQVGQVVRLAVDAAGVRQQRFRIDGIYEPMPDPMRFAQPRYEARLHLPDLLALTADPDDPLADGAVTSINVALENPADAAEVAADIAQRLPDLAAMPVDAGDERAATFVVLERFHLAIAIVTVVGAAVFLLALMVMLVDERRATVGTLRLLGFTRRRILVQVMTEGAVIALAGAVFGILVALATERSFNSFFQWRYDTALVFLRITPPVVGTALLFAIPLGMLASLIASWTLLREQLLVLIRR